MSGERVLWHFTCSDHDAEIESSGELRTNLGLVWLTDLPEPDREGLGLTSQILTCDRTAHRFRVLDDTGIEPWTTVGRRWVRPSLARDLEKAPGADPSHWFVARNRVPVVRDERQQAAS